MKDRNVYENVAFAQRVVNRPTRVIRKRVPEVLQEVGLAVKYKSFPDELSGGEQQRVAIARAVVKDPDILILDDSASALDFATDASLRAALKGMHGDKTIFIVSQRTSSIQFADNIIVLDDGQMVGFGPHEKLLETCETYKEIYDSQFKKESDMTRQKEV